MIFRDHRVALTRSGPPRVLALKPPSSLSCWRRATPLAGAAVGGRSGRDGCREIEESGNNGPGQPLTRISAVSRPAAMSAALPPPDRDAIQALRPAITRAEQR